MESDEWGDMPLSDDMRAYIEASTSAGMAERQMQLRFAAFLCRCEPRYNHRDPTPAQHDCALHTTLVFDKRGDFM